MKEVAFVIVAGLLGLATFGILAKKYGSECMP
jgi:hypothetical protein